MKIKTTDGDYWVCFTHIDNSKTGCFIYGTNKDVPLASEWAHCHKNDQFNKRAGRKVAFSRALCKLFDRPIRKQFWQQYFVATNQCGKTAQRSFKN